MPPTNVFDDEDDDEYENEAPWEGGTRIPICNRD
jgi:hypothetical protein